MTIREFAVRLFTDHFISGISQTNLNWGHNFNREFGSIRSDTAYTAMQLILEYFDAGKANYNVEEMNKWLSGEGDLKYPHFVYRNKTLIWNLFYAIR